MQKPVDQPTRCKGFLSFFFLPFTYIDTFFFSCDAICAQRFIAKLADVSLMIGALFPRHFSALSKRNRNQDNCGHSVFEKALPFNAATRLHSLKISGRSFFRFLAPFFAPITELFAYDKRSRSRFERWRPSQRHWQRQKYRNTFL